MDSTSLSYTVHFYRPQTKFAKVMFLQECVCPRGGGRAWPGGMRGRGACMAGGGGCSWCGKYYGIWSMSGQYASYWNAFLFLKFLPPAKGSCGKVMVSHVSVILSREGGRYITCIMR